MRGDPSKKGKPKNEPEPLAGDIVAPDWVTGKSLEKWADVVPKLQGMRVITPADVDAVAQYCVMHEQWVRYLDQVRRGLDVLVIRDKDGKVKYMQASPAATMFVKLQAAMLKIAREFGLTPSSRVGMEVANANKEIDPLDEFLRASS